MNVKYYDIVLVIVQVILIIAHLNTSGFAEAMILIAQAILFLMQGLMRPDGCEDK